MIKTLNIDSFVQIDKTTDCIKIVKKSINLDSN